MLSLQPQQTVLVPSSLQAIEDLKRSTTYQDKYKTHLSKAVQLITEVSAQINDRGLEQSVRYNRRRNKRAANGQSEDEEDKQEHEGYEEKVESLTKKMDMSIRKVIDDQIWLGDLPNALSHVKQRATNVSRGATSTQATTQRTEDEMDVDDTQEPDEDRHDVRPDPSQAPTALLDAAFSANHTRWTAKTLTERYSEHNDYVGWYRMVYDAKHPGENPPPMPHASMWFAEEEDINSTLPRGSQSNRRVAPNGKASTRTRPASHSDSESDIEIAAERVRIKCPITLVPYKDPVASTKCPHAFEKSAILEMFKHTAEHLPFTPEQLTELSQCHRPQDRQRREREIRTPMVRCPECSVPLTQEDLRPDPVLLRKVKRILEKEKRAEEAAQRQGEDDIDMDDDDEDGPPRGTQRRQIVHLGSSPARSIKRQSGRVIKGERLSKGPEPYIEDLEDED